MARDSLGNYAAIEDMDQTIAYNADGTIDTITATMDGQTWVQTFAYTSGQLTNVSAWVKQ